MGRQLCLRTGHSSLGGRGVQPRGWSQHPSGPMGRQNCPTTGQTGLGGTGSPAQGVVGVSFRAHGEAAVSKNRAHPPRGDTRVQPREWSEYPSGPIGRQHCPRTGHTRLGGTGSPAQGVVVVSFRAHMKAASSWNRAHRLGGDRESCPGVVGVSFCAHGKAAAS